MDTKPFYTSKTFWGVAVMACSLAAQAMGKQIAPDTAAKWVDALTAISGLVGAALAGYGRMDATSRTTIAGKVLADPSEISQDPASTTIQRQANTIKQLMEAQDRG